jgi:hypothetical protein
MGFKRPPLDLVIARKWEIKRRYSRKSKVGKRSRSMAAIRLAELTRWLHHTHGERELSPSDSSINICRIFAHHMGSLPQADRRIASWLDRYASWIDVPSRERLISEVIACPLKFSADKLAWKIGLTDAMRTALRIRTIGAIDCTKEQRQARRKRQDAERKRTARRDKRPQHID